MISKPSSSSLQGESVNTGLDYWTTGLDFDLKKYTFANCQSLENSPNLLSQHGYGAA